MSSAAAVASLGSRPAQPSANAPESAAPDYVYVEQAIRYIERHTRQQPSLADIAGHVGTSEFHLQRVFTRWAGISPKRFLQYLTHEHCRQLLRESRSVLDATYEAGLSSPGRLHDLFVTVEAVTPGEYKTAGSGLEITHGVHQTPFGDALIATTPRGVCSVNFVSADGEPGALEQLREQWSGASFRKDTAGTAEIAARIFAPVEHSSAPRMRLFLKGSNFQINVWKALLKIPLGAVTSYEGLAAMANVPGAPRAVGNAVGANPLAYLIPCHRVIRKTGEFGNYGGGPARKKAMLVWESAQAAGDGADDDSR